MECEGQGLRPQPETQGSPPLSSDGPGQGGKKGKHERTRHTRRPMERVRKPIPEGEAPGWVGEGWELRQATGCVWEPDPCALLVGSGFPASSLPGFGQCLLSPFLRVDPHLWLYLYYRVRLYPITQASGLCPIKKTFPAPCKAGNTQLPFLPRRHVPATGTNVAVCSNAARRWPC